MNQNEFFNILMDGLKDFPEIKLQDIISYYENNFRLGLASGKTEQEILSELGDPNLIVNKYRNEDLETPTRDAYITPDNNNNNNNNNYSNYNSKFNNILPSYSWDYWLHFWTFRSSYRYFIWKHWIINWRNIY